MNSRLLMPRLRRRLRSLLCLWQRASSEGERGSILLETILSVPLLVILLATLGTMVVFGAREYIHILADAELQQEIQIAFQRVTTDALEAKDITRAAGRDSGITFVKRPNPLRTDYRGEEIKVNYWLNTVEGTKKLVRESASAPMTGNHALAGISITEFSYHEVRPRLYQLRLRGHSGVTGHEYELSTAIYIPST